MNGIYNIGLQSLMSYQNAMNTVAQNIANVATPFYSRKLVNLSEGLYDTGVMVGNATRVYDQSTSQNVQQCSSNYASADLYLRNMKYFEPLLDNDQNNVAKYLNDSIKALTSLNGDPSIYDNRVGYLDKLNMMCNQFNALSTQMQAQYNNINQQLQSTVSSINDIVSSIAELNVQILDIPAGQDPSSLQDQREQLVQSLSQYLNFSANIDNSGQVNLTLSNGATLLLGGQATTLGTMTDTQYPLNQDICVSNGGNSSSINSMITSGQLGGLLSYRNTLYTSQQALGRLAIAISQTMNAQNKLGMDYNGNLGGNLFNDVNAANTCLNRVIPALNNAGTGNMNVTITNVQNLQVSDYKMVFDTPTHYTLTRLVDNTVMSSGTLGALPQSVSVDGFSINVTGGMIAAGDQFTITPTSGAISSMGLAITDPKLLALALPVTADPSTANTGDGSISLTGVLDTTNPAFSTPQALNPPLQIQFLTDSTYQIVNANTNAVMEGPLTYTSGANLFPTPGGYNPGYQLQLSGGIKAGDMFNVNYNSNGAGDNRNGILMGQIYTNGCTEGGTLSFLQDYRTTSGDVSRLVSDAQQNYTSAQVLQRQSLAQFNEISGVNTQEEQVNLMTYQQAYQASAQILQTAQSIFQAVISMMR